MLTEHISSFKRYVNIVLTCGVAWTDFEIWAVWMQTTRCKSSCVALPMRIDVGPIADDLYTVSNTLFVCVFVGVKVSGAGMGDNLAGLTYHASNNDDPYITLKNVVGVACGSGLLRRT